MKNDDVILIVDDRELRISQTALRQLCARLFIWVLHPDSKHPYSGLITAIRIAVKGVLRPVLPRLLKQLYESIGEQPPEIPRARDVDLLEWLIPHLAQLGIRQLANRRWVANLEMVGDGHTNQSDNKAIYAVRGLSPIPLDDTGREDRATDRAATSSEKSEY